jgi:oligopeptidase A
MTSPLLDTSTLPRFDQLSPADILPSIERLICDHRAQLNALLEQNAEPDFESLVIPFEQMEHELGRAWSPVVHLQSVLGSPEWRDAYNQTLPLMTEHGTEISQDSRLQRAYAAVQKSLPANASESHRSAVDQALRNFHLAGVDLAEADKNRFKEIMQLLAAAQASFEQNVQDTSDAWSMHIVDESRLDGIPRQSLERAAEDAQARELPGWLLLLNYPTFDAVIKHAHDRSLREELYRAWVTRGSDQGQNSEWDNSENIKTIIALRHEAAKLVGFDNYADYSLATKMAASTGEVLEFLNELASRSRAAAKSELADLVEFAGMELEPWDITFWLEKFKQAKYSISNEELRQYFPAQTVINGLFNIAERLYGVRLAEQEDVALWHKDASDRRMREPARARWRINAARRLPGLQLPTTR